MNLEGIEIHDPPNPPFIHEVFESTPERELQHWKLGIGLDYFSELGHVVEVVGTCTRPV